MKTRRGLWVWSAWKGNKRMKTIVVRNPKHRDKAPKRRKVAARRARVKDAFF